VGSEAKPAEGHRFRGLCEQEKDSPYSQAFVFPQTIYSVI